jgi:tryptophan synthase alpha chain
MNLIDKTFDKLKSENKKAFIAFITGGDPSLDHLGGLVKGLEKGGADIIEIGIPYSDPLADGPVIQEANQRAFANDNLNVDNLMVEVKKIRPKTSVPLLYLVYINTIVVYGKEKFIKACVDAGINGLIIPDMPLEERDELLPYLEGTDIHLIPLVAPTTKDRLPDVLTNCGGFVYCVSSLGVTGRSSDFYGGVEDYLASVKTQTDLPVAVGFGISTNEDVKALSPYVDGVIVGSAIVRKVAEGKGDPDILTEFVKELKG